MEQSGSICPRCALAAVVCLTILLGPKTPPAGPAVKLNVQEARGARDTHPAMSFAPIAKRVSPNVVNIFTTRRARGVPRLDEPLSQFFGPRQGDGSVPRQRREQSLGSGVILTDDGYIATNNHVVAAADQVRVVLPDGKEFTAKIGGADQPAAQRHGSIDHDRQSNARLSRSCHSTGHTRSRAGIQIT